MPTYPEEKSQSYSSGKDIFEVHSLSERLLLNEGWTLTYTPTTINIPTYTKNENTIIYKCHKWYCNNKEVQFIEDIK